MESKARPRFTAELCALIGLSAILGYAAAHQGGIWVGVCGEMAGDPEAAPILLGLGLDEFSMAPGAVPRIKAILRRWSYADAASLAARALNLDSAEEVRELVRSWS